MLMPRAKPEDVELLILDVDGCLTDGSVYLGPNQEDLKRFNIKDGLGIAIWNRLGYETAIITGRSSLPVLARARELGVDRVFLGVKDKSSALAEVLKETGIPDTKTAAIGDDWNDFPVLNRVGFAACPADASPEVVRIADYVCQKPGGRGCVRELIEHILTAKGRLDEAVGLYSTL